MGHKKVTLDFLENEIMAGVEIELHDPDNFSLRLTEQTLKPKHIIEIFIGLDEVKTIINSLQFLLDEDNAL